MQFVRHYILDAKPDAVETLRTTLMSIRDTLIACPGNQRVELLEAAAPRCRFVFIEYWDSRDNHAGAGAYLPAALMETLKSTLAGPPQSTDLTAIERG